MCRLLGLACNRPVNLAFTLPHFAKLSKCNPDTWGIGWYDNVTATVKKGEGKLARSPELEALRMKVRSQIFISHVRRATSEPFDVRGAHPFKCHVLGRDWIFAHNGGIDQNWLKLRLRKPPSIGPDSRFYFRYLIEGLQDAPERPVEETLADCLQDLRGHSATALNFLMSDGSKLYAFCGFNSSNKEYYTLQMTNSPRIQPRELTSASSGYSQMLYGKLARGERAILVCSQDITSMEGEDWDPLGNGTLVTIERDTLSTREHSVW